jgi:hypothetical protein
LSWVLLELEMPQLLLLLTLRILSEDLEQVAALSDLAVSICVNYLSEIFHEAEVRSHCICESSHLAELRDQRNLSTSLSVLVNQKRLIRFLDILIVACLVVLLVGDLFKKIMKLSIT